MAAATKRRKRRRRREPLVRAHLEQVSRRLLEKHPDIVRQIIGKNAGIYALYRKDRLYYVGLASKLSSRLRQHIRDRHGRSWDRFSIYLTIQDAHQREIEALVLRIASPAGNKVSGKPARSQNMRRLMETAIREKQAQEVSALFGPKRGKRRAANVKEPAAGAGELVRLLPSGARIRGVLKGKTYQARVLPDGRVRYNGQHFASLSTAASAALGRAANGWWFWRVERSPRSWVRLKEIRRAGTPIHPR